jgi:hypothetical protein
VESQPSCAGVLQEGVQGRRSGSLRHSSDSTVKGPLNEVTRCQNEEGAAGTANHGAAGGVRGSAMPGMPS